jgi:ketosteroid isomerase-like protein
MSDQAQNNQKVLEEIKAVSEAWEKAIRDNNSDAIARFMTNDWTIVSGNGITTRDRFLEVVASGDLTHEIFEGEITAVRDHGDIAILTGRMKSGGAFKNHPFSSDEWVSDVFIKQDGEWKCVHSHITAVEESKVDC